jgi:predicted transcriptional regulator
MTRSLDPSAQKVLRTLFDLADADVRPSLDLLGRLLDLDATRAKVLIVELRRAGLVQRDRLNLTMAGLAFATSISDVELEPMRAPVRLLRVA